MTYVVPEEALITERIFNWSLEAYKANDLLAIELIKSHEEAMNTLSADTKKRFAAAIRRILDEKPWEKPIIQRQVKILSEEEIFNRKKNQRDFLNQI